MIVASALRSLALASVVSLGPIAGAAQTQDGEIAFRRRCAACHTVEEGVNRSGPSLANLYGRVAGTLEGARFSAPMRNSGLIWDAETLEAFLAAPRALVPGTTMTLTIRDEAERRSIAEFLRQTN